MKVTLDLQKHTCIVEKEPGDPTFKDGGWAEQPESTFLYHVKKALIKQGYDVIKKRMWADGHLVSNTQQYLRSRRFMVSDEPTEFCIWNGNYALWDAGDRFNKEGWVELCVMRGDEG